LFIPRARLGWVHVVPGSASNSSPQGGVPGEVAYFGTDGATQGNTAQGSGSTGSGHWVVSRVGGPPDWNLLNQSWNCQLAPVVEPSLATILQSDPQLPDFDAQNFKLPNMDGLTNEDIQFISPH
jgi:hypothetical protein